MILFLSHRVLDCQDYYAALSSSCFHLLCLSPSSIFASSPYVAYFSSYSGSATRLLHQRLSRYLITIATATAIPGNAQSRRLSSSMVAAAIVCRRPSHPRARTQHTHSGADRTLVRPHARTPPLTRSPLSHSPRMFRHRRHQMRPPSSWCTRVRMPAGTHPHAPGVFR